MSNLDVLSMGIRNLLKRKLRTFLTILGVVVGTTAIVAMVSLGIGVNVSFEEQVKMWGDLTIIRVYNWQGYNGGSSDALVLDDAMIKQFNDMAHVTIATPIIETGYKFVSGKYSAWLSIRGMYPEAMEAMGYKVEQGDLLPEEGEGYTIVFSSQAAFNFTSARQRGGGGGVRVYGGGVMVAGNSGGMSDVPAANVDPMKDRFTMSYDYSYGEKVVGETTGKKADTYKIKVMGVMTQSDDWERSYYSVMPIAQVQKITKDQQKWEKSNGSRGGNETKGYQTALVKVDDMKNALKVVEKIKELGFTDTYSPTEEVKRMTDMMAGLQMLLAAIGGVSLFVAAIGIANTMLMSIYERTKEIGVMKVIGAKLNDIGKLFLLESMIIGFAGGVFGIGLSYLVSYILNNVKGLSIIPMQMYSETTTISVIPVWLAVAALAFATFIGLISGFMPARRAMRISAINAIRTE